jgi:carbonic anhydrase
MRKLIKGIVDFRERLLPEYAQRFRELAEVQAPDALFITCSDSRVVPDLLASTDPGDLFVMRNVGNLIPPATVEGASTGDLSEASAIEYSILVLNVNSIVVCGHSECGAMKAAVAGQPMPDTPNLEKWLHHCASAVFRLDQEGPLNPQLSRHPLADFPEGHALSKGIDLADHFMARNARVANVGSEPFDGEDV